MKANALLTKTPPFKGKTAWELLDFITWLIQREPKRYDQGIWVRLVEQGYTREFVEHHMPSCGTIGCVAGWVDVLVNGRKTLLVADRVADKTQRHARRILKLSREAAIALFTVDAVTDIGAELNLEGNDLFLSPGTSEYAELGVLHIRRFMLAHETHLRRTLVKKARGAK